MNTTLDVRSIPPERCEAALEISRQPQLLFLLSLTVCVSVVGWASAGLLAYYLYKRPVYHINIRLLMWSMCVALALLSSGVCCLSIDHLMVFALNQNDPCKMVVRYSECHKKRSLVLILPGFVVANSAVALAIERGYATYAYRTYDMRPSRIVGIGLVTAQWVIGSVPTIVNYAKMMNDGLVGSMPYCISAMITPATATVGFSVSIIIDLATLSSVSLLLFINSRKLSRKVGVESATVDGGHLSRRYQLTENLKTTRMLIPCLIGHTLVNLVSSCAGLYMATGRLESDADVSRMASVNELASLLAAFYTPVFCVTCIVQSPSLLHQVRSEWVCLQTPTDDSALPDAAVDNEMVNIQLDNLWKSNKIRPQSGENVVPTSF